MTLLKAVIPAKAGIQFIGFDWAPVFTGVTSDAKKDYLNV